MDVKSLLPAMPEMICPSSSLAGRGDHGSRILRPVGVPDIDRDVGYLSRVNGILVEHGCSHISQFPQFSVGDPADRLRVVNDPGIRHQESRYVRPVLIDIRFHRPGYERAGDVGASSGERLDAAIDPGSVEARDHCLVAAAEHLLKFLIRPFLHEFAFVIELDDFGCIHEFEPQIGCDQLGVQIFAPARDIVHGSFRIDIFTDLFQFFFHAHVDAQAALHGEVAVADDLEDLLISQLMLNMGPA